MILGALSSQNSSVEAGVTFCRRGAGALVEIAHVLDVSRDKMGIPHVRFELQVSRGGAKPTPENRTLSLEAFQARYKEKLKEGA